VSKDQSATAGSGGSQVDTISAILQLSLHLDELAAPPFQSIWPCKLALNKMYMWGTFSNHASRNGGHNLAQRKWQTLGLLLLKQCDFCSSCHTLNVQMRAFFLRVSGLSA